MADAVCTNNDCPEHDTPKDPGVYSIEIIRCGACGEPMSPVNVLTQDTDPI